MEVQRLIWWAPGSLDSPVRRNELKVWQPSEFRRDEAMMRPSYGDGGSIHTISWPSALRAEVTRNRARVQAGEGSMTPCQRSATICENGTTRKKFTVCPHQANFELLLLHCCLLFVGSPFNRVNAMVVIPGFHQNNTLGEVDQIW